jgi:hypothetical protein
MNEDFFVALQPRQGRACAVGFVVVAAPVAGIANTVRILPECKTDGSGAYSCKVVAVVVDGGRIEVGLLNAIYEHNAAFVIGERCFFEFEFACDFLFHGNCLFTMMRKCICF